LILADCKPFRNHGPVIGIAIDSRDLTSRELKDLELNAGAFERQSL
jgi:hypothetical protein